MDILDDMLAGVGMTMQDYLKHGENDYYPPLPNGHRLFLHDIRRVAVRCAVAMGEEGDMVVSSWTLCYWFHLHFCTNLGLVISFWNNYCEIASIKTIYSFYYLAHEKRNTLLQHIDDLSIYEIVFRILCKMHNVGCRMRKWGTWRMSYWQPRAHHTTYVICTPFRFLIKIFFFFWRWFLYM